ncbi:MAG: RagB/SusD family nutrient uptake outer membrane protein [Gemmatimonadetes bacterium]|nr:RagB/SusD family nutrient uptake outer membrane protein [Gemmatimonadota bacterium]
MKVSTKRAALVGTGFVVLSGAMYSCENFLETPAQGTLDSLTLGNRAGVEATLVGAYRLLGGWVPGLDLAASSPSNWVFASATSDDAYKGGEPGLRGAITELQLYNWTAGGADSYLNDKWKSVYEGISRTNATLRLLKQVQKDAPNEIPAAQARSIEGEALFLRAHYHFEGWRMWGNIPHYSEADADFRKPNNSELVPLILADLEAAIGLLSPTPRNGEKGRVTQWTAKAYKGRVQMYAGMTQQALPTLRDVANNGPYKLEQNFHRVWTGFAAFANGPETILAYQASANDGSPGGENANFAERLNFPHSGSPFGCCGTHQPSQNLVNFYRVDANGLPLALGGGDLTPLSATARWNASSAEFEGGNMAPVDPRLDWTVGRDAVPYKDWGPHESSWIRDLANGGPYSPKKNVHEKTSGAESKVGWVPTALNSMNFHLYRFADLLLMLAEAEVEAGNLEAARQIVNRIRERAGAVAQGPGTSSSNIAVPINDPSITWADYEVGLYTTAWTNKDFARSAVRYERRLELAMEGHRFFDLRRWAVIEPVLNEYIQVEQTRRPYLKAASQVTGRHKLFPIPSVQVALSNVDGAFTLQQNPGW